MPLVAGRVAICSSGVLADSVAIVVVGLCVDVGWTSSACLLTSASTVACGLWFGYVSDRRHDPNDWGPGMRDARGSGARRALGLVVVVLSTTVALAGGPSRVSADAVSLTGDESVKAPTGWWAYSGVSVAQVKSLLAQKGARLTDVEIYDSTPKFTVTMVRNAGSYAAPGGWWWYYGLTLASVKSRISANGARLIDIQPYSTGSGIRYAVVMVKNAGSANRAWWWYTGVSSASVSSALSTNKARLVDLETYTEGGVKKYAVIMVRNSGSDAKSWQWWLNQTSAGVSAKLNSFGGRLVDLHRQSNGTYNAIMVKQTGSDNIYYRYYFGLPSIARVIQIATLYNTRVVDVETYVSGANRRYDAIMIDNANAESRRLTNLMAPVFTDSSGLPTAQFGYYVKRVDSSVVVDSAAGLQYEPASAIKALHNLRAMKDIQSGAKTLTSTGFYYNYPNSPNNAGTKDACPVDGDEIVANRVTASFDFLHDNMMSISDNRTTRYFAILYGLPNLKATALGAGMTNTVVGQARLGCGKLGGANFTTLTDLGRLYEGVENGTQLNDINGARAEFYQPMNNGISTALQTVVNQEAAKLGKSVIANDFFNAMSARVKGGSYNIACAQLEPGCKGAFYYYRDFAGRILIPFKVGGVITPANGRSYVYGRYVDSLRLSNGASTTAFDNISATIDVEMLRTTINAALQTW